MQTDQPRRIYALIPTDEALAATDYAPLEEALSLADRCAGAAHAVLVGANPDAAIDRAKALGVSSVWIVSPPCPQEPLQTHQLADAFAAALLNSDAIAPAPDSILLVAAGSTGEAIAGQLAGRIKATPLGKCTRFNLDTSGSLRVQRAAFGGRLNVMFDCREGPFIAAIRKPDNVQQACSAVRPETVVHHLACTVPLRPAYPITATARTEQHASLEGARLVVSGGRGMGSEAGFTSLYKLAAELGGAVGVSLPAIDAGWAPVARQVGQSGKYVAPEIYLAIGISGTPQHMAGIDLHTEIIAINQDPEADIFKMAHMGVIADWKEFLPALMQELETDQASSP